MDFASTPATAGVLFRAFLHYFARFCQERGKNVVFYGVGACCRAVWVQAVKPKTTMPSATVILEQAFSPRSFAALEDDRRKCTAKNLGGGAIFL